MSSPELSVVLVNKYGLERLRRVIDALARQAIANQLEVVIVSPFDAPSQPNLPFHDVRYVRCGPIQSLGRLRAQGVMACTAPFLVFAEDHCFPQPGWAEALLARLREGWTGVGAVILNHNPATWISRADWTLHYSAYTRDANHGEVRTIPPHNSAYPTATLQALGEDLATLLEMDHHLQTRLLSEGGRLFLEPAARTLHVNSSRLWPHWAGILHGNRIYGATRAATGGWPVYRRVAYAAGLPAIAALCLARACRGVERWRDAPLAPLLILAALLGASGEAWGYLAGPGRSFEYRVNQELDRLSSVISAERPLLLA